MKKVEILRAHDIDDLRKSVEHFLDNPYIELIDVKITTENRTIKNMYGSTQVTTDIACIIYEETEHVELNGLLWFVNNCSLLQPESIGSYGFNRQAYYKKHFHYSELKDLQESNNGRLPTSDEFMALLNLPHIWDKNRMGFWFASEKNLLMTNKSLFIGINVDDSVRLNDSVVYYTGDHIEDVYNIIEVSEKERKLHRLSPKKGRLDDSGASYENRECMVRLVRDL